jgi:hypothetical protein
VNSAQDIIDRGLIPVIYPGHWFLVESLRKSDNELYQILGQIAFVPNTWQDWNNLLIYHVQGAGTHVLLGSHISESMRYHGLFHASPDHIEGSNPYYGWITNKLFYLKDDLKKHVLIYQQVC